VLDFLAINPYFGNVFMTMETTKLAVTAGRVLDARRG
jgi:hypothetical protein